MSQANRARRTVRPQNSRRAFPLGGRRAAVEAIRAGLAVSVLAAKEAHRTPGFDQLLADAESAGLTVERVAREELDRTGAPDHQGVVAFVLPPPELDERELAGIDAGPDALAVVLDGITDPQNLGACARSAEAAGAMVLVIRRARSAPVTPAAIRASAGALLHLPVARVPNLTRALHHLKERGFFVVGLDGGATDDVYAAARPAGPLAMVVGAEGTGLSRLVGETCDLLVRIPMSGKVGSLNASAALSAALFAYARRPERSARRPDPNIPAGTMSRRWRGAVR